MTMHTRAVSGPTQFTTIRAGSVFLAFLFLINLFNYTDRVLISILQELIKKDLRLSDAQLGLVSGLGFSLLYSLSSIPIARIAERKDRVTVLTVATIVWSAATAACGAVTNFAQLFIARSLTGMGEGACSPTSYSLLGDHFVRRKLGAAMSILNASNPVATIAAPILGAYIASTVGWRWTFVVIGAPGVLLALLLRRFVRDTRPAPEVVEGGRGPGTFLHDLGLLARNAAYRWVVLGGIVLAGGISATTLFAVSFFIRQHGLSVVEAGFAAGTSLGIGGLLSTLMSGVLADRIAGPSGKAYIVIPAIGAGIAGICYMFALHVSSVSWAMGLIAVASFSKEMKNGTIQAAIQNMSPPHMRATSAAVVMASMALLGVSTGPLIAGLLSDYWAAADFPVQFGHFATACPGGYAPAGSSADLTKACASAIAAGIKYGLTGTTFAYFAAAFAFSMAAIRLRSPGDA